MGFFGAGTNVAATGTFSVTVDSTGALLVEAAGGTDILNVDTVGPAVTIAAPITFADQNIILGTTTGTKIGTATTQKLAFFNSAPVVQQAGTVDPITALKTFGLMAAGTTPLTVPGAFVASGTTALNGAVTIGDAIDVVLNATTGTKIGTATSQKLAFFNSTPVVQQAGTADPITVLKTFGLMSAGTTPLTVPGALVASGTAALNGTITIGDGINIVVNATTGTKIGTATTQKIGFYNAAPIIQPSAYTQTFVTADKTHADSTVGADILAFTDPPSAAEMATLRTFVNNLKADVADLKALVNSVIDDLQALGLVG